MSLVCELKDSYGTSALTNVVLVGVSDRN